jgi:hypothetical protein
MKLVMIGVGASIALFLVTLSICWGCNEMFSSSAKIRRQQQHESAIALAQVKAQAKHEAQEESRRLEESKKQSELRQQQELARRESESPKELTQEQLLQADEDLVQSHNVSLMMVTADNYRLSGKYDRATKLYLCVAMMHEGYPTEAAFALMKIAKYCYPHLSVGKQNALKEILGEDFYDNFKNAKI